MIKGNNLFMLNEATVISAIEMYLNDAITATDDYVEVTSVFQESGSPRTFRVAVKPKKESK